MKDNNSAVLFIKSLLAMIRSEDAQKSILCYEEAAKANSLCHPSHVPHAPDELDTYFPRIFVAQGKITVTFRLTTSIPVSDIKKRIMHKLMEAGFFLYPSRLSAARKGQVGWLYLAHPDLTNREEFATILRPLLQKHTRESIDLQAVYEFINSATANSIRQRLVVLRCDFEKLDRVRNFCMEAFA